MEEIQDYSETAGHCRIFSKNNSHELSLLVKEKWSKKLPIYMEASSWFHFPDSTRTANDLRSTEAAPKLPKLDEQCANQIVTEDKIELSISNFLPSNLRVSMEYCTGDRRNI